MGRGILQTFSRALFQRKVHSQPWRGILVFKLQHTFSWLRHLKVKLQVETTFLFESQPWYHLLPTPKWQVWSRFFNLSKWVCQYTFSLGCANIPKRRQKLLNLNLQRDVNSTWTVKPQKTPNTQRNLAPPPRKRLQSWLKKSHVCTTRCLYFVSFHFFNSYVRQMGDRGKLRKALP